MIVRILGEGQFDLPDEAVDQVNVLDAEVERAVAAGDQVAFEAALVALLEGVRAASTPHDDAALDESDAILPPADATLDEVRELLSDDGLIPGSAPA